LKYNEAMSSTRDPSTRTVFEIEDLATLDVINDPLRMRIVHLTSIAARTVKEMAEELGVPVTRLYYHVNLLTEVGVIEIAETEKVGAMIQRRFRAVADDYRLAKTLTDSMRDDVKLAEVAAATVLDGARLDAEAMLARHFADPEDQPPIGAFGRTFFTLEPDRVAYWQERLSELVEEIDRESDAVEDGEVYSFTYVFAELASPFRGGTT
jgi:DNA-binding transcriptional ArsR family regulator